jgi:hypothetical protein
MAMLFLFVLRKSDCNQKNRCNGSAEITFDLAARKYAPKKPRAKGGSDSGKIKIRRANILVTKHVIAFCERACTSSRTDESSMRVQYSRRKEQPKHQQSHSFVVILVLGVLVKSIIYRLV